MRLFHHSAYARRDDWVEYKCSDDYDGTLTFAQVQTMKSYRDCWVYWFDYSETVPHAAPYADRQLRELAKTVINNPLRWTGFECQHRVDDEYGYYFNRSRKMRNWNFTQCKNENDRLRQEAKIKKQKKIDDLHKSLHDDQ